MGTLFNENKTANNFYNKCFKAFKNKNVNVILSVGKNTDISKINNIPHNFVVRNYVSQLDVLKKTNLFITHGGMGSVNEGLYFGVPLVVIPMGFDQPLVAKRVKEVGAGLVLNKDNITEKCLLNVTKKIINNPQFAQKSRELGKSLKEAGGYKKAVDCIFEFKNKVLDSTMEENYGTHGKAIIAKKGNVKNLVEM